MYHLQIEDTSTEDDVAFKSNFMGSFATGVFVPPNTIDFDNVIQNFSELIKDNWQVLLLVILLCVLYVPLAVLVRRLDIKDRLHVNNITFIFSNVRQLLLFGSVSSWCTIAYIGWSSTSS